MKNWRINLILIFIILFGATIVSRLIYIQVLNQEYYKALAQGQQKILETMQGERGEIFFNGGQILATNVESQYLFISPREIEEKTTTVESLSEILNVNKDMILEKMEKDNSFEIIKQRLEEEEIAAVKELNLTGVYFGPEIWRSYPQESLASQVVGFLGGNTEGQYGIENYYDDILQGKKGLIERAKKGSDIWLTLDYNIQFRAEKLLKQAKEDLGIGGGQIIVLDPNSGKILALANFPGFDPNKYEEYAKDQEIFQNGAIQKIFEPGSVFKPITMAAALDQEKITPQTTYVDPGMIKIGGWPIYNYDQRVYPGETTMTEVLEKSINTGAVFVERELGHNLFLKYIEKFGFFEPTEIDLQGEIYSENKEFKKGYEINFATVSFGQGIEITPIQLARAFSVIANGGKLVKPYLVEKISENGFLSQDSKVIEIQPEISENNIISSRTASQLTAMLVSVVKNGFAKSAQVPGYYVAGKTGTAQISFSALEIPGEGYSDKTWQTFVGFAPAFNPQFLILIKLDNPKTKTAEYSAVPIFKDLAKHIIDYWQIPPDYEE
ncbi:peptidoglycan D,D-transpeptidase FtsI family protein [Patescibacteria group bacterium]